MKRRKLTPKQLIEKEAGKIWSEIVLSKNDGRCLVCGKKAEHPHHFVFKSRSLALKYDIRNGIPLCSHCHLLIHGRQDPVVQGIIVLKKGKKWLDYINSKKRLKTVKTKIWLEHQLNDLKSYPN